MSYNLVLMEDSNGEQVPSYNEKGEVLVHNSSEDSYYYMALSDELVAAFPQLRSVEEPMEMDSVGITVDGKSKAYWTYDATILLINKYKHFQPYFADSIHKNVEVWDAIAKEFEKDGYSFCGGQCENRWKYIRGKYLKKKDNGGPGSTGDELYQFEYYNEMDDVLGKKPNVVPKYLASSESSKKSNRNTNIRAPKRPLLSSAQGRSTLSDIRTSSLINQRSSNSASFTASSNVNNRSTSGSVNLATSLPRLDIESSSNSQSVTGGADMASLPRLDIGSSSNSQSVADGAYDPLDTRSANQFFDDHDDSPPLSPSSEKSKGKHRKEPWDENVQRQDRYHQEMMQVQRESNNMMKEFMSQILDCFRRT